MKGFDYYIFIDYSENLIGYSITDKDKLKELLPKILRFRHYRDAGNRKQYLRNIKKTFKKDNIKSYFLKLKIKEMRKNMEIYLDVLEFLKTHQNCIIFISVDIATDLNNSNLSVAIFERTKSKWGNILVSRYNSQYPAFRKMINILDKNEVVIKQESELIKGTPEYRTSLVLDNLLNIERLKNGK